MLMKLGFLHDIQFSSIDKTCLVDIIINLSMSIIIMILKCL